MTQAKPKVLVGAHTSAAGGAPNALLQGAEIGATTIQLFTSNQKQWTGRKISEEEVELWKKTRKETKIDPVTCHDSYLINLGSPKPDVLEKSKNAFQAEIERCHLFEIDYLNFHPGAATTSTKEECLDTIVNSLLEFTDLAKKGSTRLLLETTAGQGTTIGSNFQELGYIIKKVKDKLPIGVCIDTCHIFAAGYDIRTGAAWDKTLDAFEKNVGLSHLYAFHLNDSLHPLGSRKDRHAPLGQGEIGIECFKYIMTHPKFVSMPKYLETPKVELWPDEIAMLKRFTTGKHHGKTAKSSTKN